MQFVIVPTMKVKQVLTLVFFLQMGTLGLFAQSQEKVDKRWTYLAEPYMMFPNMSGQTTVRNLPEMGIDADEASILGNLRFGAMLFLEAKNDTWAITSDFIYMKLEQGLEGNRLVDGGKVQMEELAWEVGGLRRIAPWFEAGVGARLMSLETSLDLQFAGGGTQNGSMSKTWVDPIVIARAGGSLRQKWLWQVKADLGGFGIGSDFAWQAQVYAGYRFAKWFETNIGYRFIGIDYDKGDGQDRFLYDVDTYGWVIRFGFRF